MIQHTPEQSFGDKNHRDRFYETVCAVIAKQYPDELSKEDIIKIVKQCDLAWRTITEFPVK